MGATHTGPTKGSAVNRLARLAAPLLTVFFLAAPWLAGLMLAEVLP